jgi:hypothetical protein
MTSSASWNYITQEATKVARSWTYGEAVRFHYFNPNGLYARKRANDKKIDNLVDREVCRSGAIMAYGGLQTFETAMLIEGLFNKKRVGRIEYLVAIEMLEDHCIKAEAFIADAEKQAERMAV